MRTYDHVFKLFMSTVLENWYDDFSIVKINLLAANITSKALEKMRCVKNVQVFFMVVRFRVLSNILGNEFTMVF